MFLLNTRVYIFAPTALKSPNDNTSNYSIHNTDNDTNHNNNNTNNSNTTNDNTNSANEIITQIIKYEY